MNYVSFIRNCVTQEPYYFANFTRSFNYVYPEYFVKGYLNDILINKLARYIPTGLGKYNRTDEYIIGLSAIPGFLLEFQTCPEVHIEKGSGPAAWIDNRLGNAPINMAEKTGGHECLDTSEH